MQPEQIIGQLLGSLVGRKRKRRPGLMGMAFGGRRRGGGLLAGGTLLTVAGLVWGALESMQTSTVAGGAVPGGASPPPPGGSAAPRPVVGGGATSVPVVPPPLPGRPAVVPPPLPGTVAAAVPSSVGSDQPVEASARTALPLLRLAIGAAHADGELSDDERAFITTQAASLGLAAEVEQVLRQRPSIESLATSFETEEQRRAAYAIAYAVIHGDGVVSPGERMYLTQLARSLRLPHEDIETIERDALGKE